MVRRKSIRTRGKFKISRYFQKIKEGDRVSISIERSKLCNVPKRMQGRTGKVIGKRGRSCIVEIYDQKKQKSYIIPNIHLIKLKTQK